VTTGRSFRKNWLVAKRLLPEDAGRFIAKAQSEEVAKRFSR